MNQPQDVVKSHVQIELSYRKSSNTMIRIALRETKLNTFFVIFASLGMSVLFALTFVLLNFRLQVTDSYLEKYKDQYLTLEIKTTELLENKIDNLFVYARQKGLTYDTFISFEDKKVKIPSYYGGICILSTNDKISVFDDMFYGEEFSPNENYIWLSETVAKDLNCTIGSSVILNDCVYYVRRLYKQDLTPIFYKRDASFFIYSANFKPEGKYSLTAVLSDPEQIMDIAKIDDGKLFEDTDGVLELCRGFNILRIGIVFIICFLIIMLIIFFVSIIRIYLVKREEFIRILFRNGISNIKLLLVCTLVFAIIAFFACTLAILWGLVFNSFIITWAQNILNITIHSPNYLVQWALGIAVSLVMILVSNPLMLRTRIYKREVSNR